MTSISTAATAEISATPKVRSRNLALDRARTFLTLVVLFHHAVIPYTYFGHTDPKSWIGFDMVVLATDSFFMAMFFFLSGLFVWPGLGHKAPLNHFCATACCGSACRSRSRVHRHSDRLLRHLAAAASRRSASPNSGGRWSPSGPWPSGPIWFVWVLLAFDRHGEPAVPAVGASRRSDQSPVAARLRPAGRVLPAFCLRSPLSSIFRRCSISDRAAGSSSGRSRCRPAACCSMPRYFFIGAGIGAANFDRGVLSADGRLAKSGWGWIAADARFRIACCG